MTGKPPLRVLMVEDSEEDAALVLRELRKSFDAQPTRLDTREALESALDRGGWDIILSDFSMPRFSATEAHAVLRDKGLDIPFIIVSGTVGEETAVRAMRLGVQDYLLKQNLTRLCPVVTRELGEKQVRTARQKAEAGLRESERRYRTLFDASPLPTFVIDDDSGQILAANEAARHRYGYPDEELRARTLASLRGPEAQPGPGTLEHHRARDGQLITVETHEHAIELDGQRQRVVVINDVTERIRAERELRATEGQLRHLQRIEAVNRLAGGIAHDFNNILSAIMSYVTLGMDELPEGDAVRADLLEALTAARRGSELTRQLLAFSRQQVLEPRVLELDRVIGGLEGMLRRLLGEDVRLAIRSTVSGARVYADPGQIEQVVMNLVVNARDAMPSGGTITVSIGEVLLDEAYVARQPTATPGAHVRLAVSDTGVGMDAATQARIFEPFFTTKEVGKGTGLGLAMVYGIVMQSRGHIAVHTAPGQGTTFEVFFPRTDRELATETPGRTSLAPSRGNETILVVEDEAQVRASMCTILRRQGYRVLSAENGAEGFEVASRSSERIHLLITDIVMPQMSGRELVEKIAPVLPDMKILFVSGYAEAPDKARALEYAFLPKPVVPSVLVERVRELLDQRRPTAPPPP